MKKSELLLSLLEALSGEHVWEIINKDKFNEQLAKARERL